MQTADTLETDTCPRATPAPAVETLEWAGDAARDCGATDAPLSVGVRLAVLNEHEDESTVLQSSSSCRSDRDEGAPRPHGRLSRALASLAQELL